MFHGACTKDAREGSAVTEPPNTEALLVTVRGLLDHIPNANQRSQHDMLYELVRILPAALDAIASERRLVGTALREQTERAEAAEAELERVRAERDAIGAALGEACAECGHIDWRSDGYADRFLGLQARLNRAVEALREIADWPLGYGIDTKARNRARVALAEIEESG
jgi:hypothetical protein